MKTSLAVTLILCPAILVVAMLVHSTTNHAQASAPVGDTDEVAAKTAFGFEFRGEVVTLRTSSFEFTLTDVEMLMIGGRKMIVGNNQGLRTGVAWDSVQHYHLANKKQGKQN